MPGCCAVGCINSSEKGYKLYRFPAKKRNRDVWIQKISRKGWTTTNNFRLCEELCQWISPHLPAERSISVEKKLLATLWLISSTESFSRVADRFGLHKGTLHRVVSMICKVLTNLQAETIQWPTHTQLQTNAEEFAKTSGIPGVIGCIDGTHIRISGLLLEHRDSYLNEKGYFSMQLQVVCNKDLLFLDVYTGWPGSIPDCQVFYNSPLKQKLESGEHPVQYHLLGDSAYQLAPYLIVPFKDNGHLTAVEKTFNHRHSSASKAVKTAVGLLKGKFCRLKNLDMTRSTDIPYLIFASCVLHNFIIRKTSVDNDGIDQYLYQDSDSEVESECDETEYEDNDLISSGIEKRKELAQQLLENET